MSFVNKSHGAVCNGRVRGCCQIELSIACLFWLDYEVQKRRHTSHKTFYISGHHEPIHVKWCVRVFHHIQLKYGHENAGNETNKQTNKQTSVLRGILSVNVASHHPNWQNLGRRGSANLFHMKSVITFRVIIVLSGY